MSINVWVAQTAEAKADVEDIKVAPDVEEVIVVDEAPSIRLDENGDIIVEAPIEEVVKEEVVKEEKPVKGTQLERKEYAKLVSKLADKTEGLFSSPTIDAKTMTLESLYVESVDEIAALEKGGAVILGAWDWNGTQVEGYPPHADLIQYMPIRKTYDDEGNETGELEPVLEDSVLVWGQGPRQFA